MLKCKEYFEMKALKSIHGGGQLHPYEFMYHNGLTWAINTKLCSQCPTTKLKNAMKCGVWKRLDWTTIQKWLNRMCGLPPHKFKKYIYTLKWHLFFICRVQKDRYFSLHLNKIMYKNILNRTSTLRLSEYIISKLVLLSMCLTHEFLHQFIMKMFTRHLNFF